MSTTRRTFLGQTLVLGGAALPLFALTAGCHSGPAASTDVASGVVQTRGAQKHILILGGTGFLGPKTVEVALARGHKVTVFNRGRTEKRIPFGFENVEHLYGNRDPLLPADDEKGPDGKLLRPDATPKGLESLVGKHFDAVIDNSGYYPRMVKASAELLSKHAQQYIFISSISAYADNSKGGDENTKLAELADPNVETMGASYENYGGLKVLCERAAEAAFPGRATIVRPGYIVGPGDPTDRFTYWPVRFSRGGDVLVPGTPEDPVQWIDVRDLAEWLVKLAEDGTAGVFHATGPSLGGRWGSVIDACSKAANGRAKPIWADLATLRENGLGGDESFPIWAPPEGESAGFHRWDMSRALAAGLKFRPVEETIAATLAWYPSEVERRKRVTAQVIADAKAAGKPEPKLPDPSVLKAGPKPESERAVLEKLAAAKK
jgi:2'-hydroxyisoflavone reductase